MRRTRGRKASKAEGPQAPDPGLTDELLVDRQSVGAAPVLTLDAETDVVDERVRGAFVRLVSACSSDRLAEAQDAVVTASVKATEHGALVVQACRPRVLRENKPVVATQWHRVTARESVAEYVRRFPPPQDVADVVEELLDAIMKECGQ